ncbi:MAG TPA: hypothetical protein VFG35_06335 [Actinoplanes sp.]|nr:hypothetical protein [Actinoplanes sp.]
MRAAVLTVVIRTGGGSIVVLQPGHQRSRGPVPEGNDDRDDTVVEQFVDEGPLDRRPLIGDEHGNQPAWRQCPTQDRESAADRQMVRADQHEFVKRRRFAQ